MSDTISDSSIYPARKPLIFNHDFALSLFTVNLKCIFEQLVAKQSLCAAHIQ